MHPLVYGRLGDLAMPAIGAISALVVPGLSWRVTAVPTTYQHRMSQGSTASLRAGHRFAQNFRDIWMMGRRSSLLCRLAIHVPQREISPSGNE